MADVETADADTGRWVSKHMTYGVEYSNTWDHLKEAATFLTYGLEEGQHACVSITRPDGSIEWDSDSDESIHDVLERAPEPPESIVIPAQTVTELRCGGCWLPLTITTTPVGANSTETIGPHSCSGVLVPAFQLTVRTEPARAVKVPAVAENEDERSDDD